LSQGGGGTAAGGCVEIAKHNPPRLRRYSRGLWENLGDNLAIGLNKSLKEQEQ